MERAPKEHFIKASHRIWISDKTVEPGTYYRYRDIRDGLAPNTRRIVFKQHNLREHWFDPRITPIFIELSPSERRFNPDRPIENFSADNLRDWPEMIVKDTAIRPEGPHPLQSPAADSDSKTKDPLQNFNDHTYTSVGRLKKTGSLGFYTLNCGIRRDFPIDQIMGIKKTPAQHLVTIFWKDDTSNTVKTSTYDLTKIALVRRFLKQRKKPDRL